MNKLNCILIISFCWLCACKHTQLQNSKPLKLRPAHIEQAFPSIPGFQYREGDISDHDNYEIISSKLVFPDKEKEINLEIYRVKSDTPKPLIIVMPISGGDYRISRFFCREFAQSGLSVAFVHRQKSYLKFKKLDKLYPNLKQIVIDHRTVLDWAEQNPQFDSNKIAAFGISLGAIKCTLLSGIDKRIKASIIALGGADIPEILRESQERGVTKIRNYFLEKNQYNNKEFHQRLKSLATFDPLDFAPYLNPASTLMFLAYFDNCVPYSNGALLQKGIGGPEAIILPTGHYTALFYIHYIAWKSSQFFQRQFSQMPDGKTVATKAKP